MEDVINLALKERAACDIAGRLPTTRFPFYGTTLQHTIAEDDSPSHEFVFEAERETLFIDMSVAAYYIDAGGDEVAVDASVTVSYCNSTYAEQTDIAAFRYCCAGKADTLLGVREGKKLRIRVDVDATVVADNDVHVEVSLNGYQGDGCCG